MSEQSEELEAFLIGCSGEASQELYEMLASFTAAHSGVTVEPVKVPENFYSFNRNLITLMDPDNSGLVVPVVTIKNMLTFEKQRSDRKGKTARFFNALCKSLNDPPSNVLPYCYIEPIPSAEQGDTASQHQSSAQQRFVGVRAEQASNLCEDLQNRRKWLCNVRDHTIEFFSDFCEELHRPAQEN